MIVTASIVTHDTRPDELGRALGCLLRAGVRHIYVVDNSGTDSLSRVIPRDERVSYRHVENRGFGAGHNIALREILDTSDYHVVMNADVSWEGDAVGRLMEYMESHPEVGLAAPRVENPDGSIQPSARRLPTPADLVAKRFLPEYLAGKRMRRYLMTDTDHSRPFEPGYLTGCFLAFRVKALRECGLFDERFFLYPEDIDISRRVAERWRVVYCPVATIVHRHEAASYRSLRMLCVHILNMVRYFNKWGWLNSN